MQAFCAKKCNFCDILLLLMPKTAFFVSKWVIICEIDSCVKAESREK